jgi:hypothetical protein
VTALQHAGSQVALDLMPNAPDYAAAERLALLARAEGASRSQIRRAWREFQQSVRLRRNYRPAHR